MRRTIIVIGILILLLLPVILFMIRRGGTPGKSFTPWPLEQRPVSSDRYSVASEVPEYSMELTDVRYLEYVADNIGIFQSEAVVDPEVYRGGQLTRHTISHIRLLLIPAISQFLVAVPGKKELASVADYLVQGDTLVIRATVNPKEQVSVSAGQFSMEDAFLRATMQAMYYAHGLSDDPTVNANAFANILSSIKDYLYIGVVTWPISIEGLAS